ncbi:TetR/AcrR family transcriptional regulator [Cellulosimicrobium cellulans]|uniref:TetR/AcrR family transcriptional regulator n=1 Tax=Cellulosimicrobium cellulans TaxID=1710 RepID=UPI001EDC805C|nr:TetR/AcrR family transcriptional regulator [Cellulosimicrobium cellulans]UKJ62593.1 TetR/AcrR family transcriptional regulator [Cellulosimicrobium cellulans]
MPRTDARRPARDRLLDAAEALFVEHGIAATGVDAVLRRAEVSPATLYAHFPGKDHLVAAYLGRRHERWRAAWDAALDRCGDDADARALAVFDALDGFPTAMSTRGCAFLAAAIEVTDPEHPAYRWLAADTRLLTERLRDLAAATGATDPDALAAELLALYDGALASRTRRAVAGDDGPTPLPWRALAAGAVARHRA